eukprot:TRINITY_DN38959_c0_g1_i1.p1 TRINITY_DN38959_c0_g1~~TRINITY_DN38959_c0_g1_i1.p1  ORF type:complete len:316 (-),score=37.21 TRINITY_DN38959_c0_g1_i1:467-1321(-)
MADDFDAELQRALEESAKLHMATCTTLRLDLEIKVPRSDLERPCSQHWKGDWQHQNGDLIQLDTLNQFAAHWAPLIEEFQTATATCGYMVMAHCVMLRQCLRGAGPLSRGKLEDIVEALRKPEAVEPVLREAMAFVSARRRAWIESHARDFPSEAERNRYMTAWVANYEISDFLRQRAEEDPTDTPCQLFARYNQWPERKVATQEEHVRLLEEERFGGCTDEKGHVTYGPDDAMFIVETIRPSRALQTPQEFLLGSRHTVLPDSDDAEGPQPTKPWIVAADLII